MITAAGADHIKRVLAGTGVIGQSLALGVGTSAESLGSTALDFEVVRSDIDLMSYDFVANRLIVKASIPADFIGTINEIGLWSQETNFDAGGYNSKIISTFESDEGWVGGTFATTNARIGVDALQHTPAASASTTSTLSDVALDFSGYSAADQFTFAYNVGNANTSQLSFRFRTDTSNYYRFDLGAQTAGYKITSVDKGTAVVTGTPNWSSITSILVITTSGAGGASSVTLDGIRVEDRDTLNPDYLLVAREVLTAPYVKVESMAQDAEFALTVNVT